LIERGDVVGRSGLGLGTRPVDVQAAHGGEQVGTEGHIRPGAGLQRVEYLGEGVRDQVVRVRSPGQRPGQSERGVAVAGEELAVRVEVAAAHTRDQHVVGDLARRVVDQRHDCWLPWLLSPGEVNEAGGQRQRIGPNRWFGRFSPKSSEKFRKTASRS